MKRLIFILVILPCFTSAQTHNKDLLDSLKFVTDMPYICRDTIPTESTVGCGDEIFWRLVNEKLDMVPLLLDLLIDTTRSDASVPNIGGQYTVADIAYLALQEIVHGIPTFDLLGVEFDTNGCGYCSYYQHLRRNIDNRRLFQARVRDWYERNRSSLVWVTSNEFSICDCAPPHPNGGYFELRK